VAARLRDDEKTRSGAKTAPERVEKVFPTYNIQ